MRFARGTIGRPGKAPDKALDIGYYRYYGSQRKGEGGLNLFQPAGVQECAHWLYFGYSDRPDSNWHQQDGEPVALPLSYGRLGGSSPLTETTRCLYSTSSRSLVSLVITRHCAHS